MKTKLNEEKVLKIKKAPFFIKRGFMIAKNCVFVLT